MRPKKIDVSRLNAMACSLHSTLAMTVSRIVKLVDGEELISFESERVRPSIIDDPHRGAIERRGAANAATKSDNESRFLRDRFA